jgi:hypothetical protein
MEDRTMSLKTILAAGVVSLVAIGTAGAAQAADFTLDFGNGGALTVSSGYGWHYNDWGHYDHERRDTLSPKQVRRILRDRGYREIDYLDKRGRTYQVRATDYRGRRVGLVVNANNGRIITAYRVR